MTVIAIAPADSVRLLDQFQVERGLSGEALRVLTVGNISTGAVDQFLGVEPPEVGPDSFINLCAPERKPGDEPGQWLYFGHMVANTSDLVAARWD